MDVKDVQEKGKHLVDRVTDTFKGKASDVTEDVIRAAVTQTLNIIQVAAEQIRNSTLPVENASLNAVVDVGLVHLSIQVNVVPKGEEVKLITDVINSSDFSKEEQSVSTNDHSTDLKSG